MKRKGKQWRSFEEARMYVRALHLNNQRVWAAFCASGQRPSDIPSNPDKVYPQFLGYGDFLGTDAVANRNRSFRPFEEARMYARGLALKSAKEWQQHCQGEKPDDIPSAPDLVYEEFVSWGNWLGTGTLATKTRQYRSFEEARAFVHTLHLNNVREWEAYVQSPRKPTDIPSSPRTVYPNEFLGWGDWLGSINSWTKAALLSLLQTLRENIAFLQEQEVYAILDRVGALPRLYTLLSIASPLHVFNDLRYNDGQALEKALNEQAEETTPDTRLSDEIGTREAIDTESVTTERSSPLLSEEAFKGMKKIISLPYLDEEILEDMILHRVNALWERSMNEGEPSVEEVLSKRNGNPYFEEITRRYRAEREAVEQLPIPSGWSFADFKGMLCMPNLMQRRVAWLVRERRRVGNWSGVGAGKTLSAILSSRVLGAKLTLVIAAHATLKQWREQLLNAFPDSLITEDLTVDIPAHGEQHWYILMNYERFQQRYRNTYRDALVRLCPDFIVLDEIQFIKYRDKEESHRRQALAGLLAQVVEAHPSCAVLGMSATPILNELIEARALLEIVTGLSFSDIGVRPTATNALAMHRLLTLHGIRHRPRYEQDLSVQIRKEVRNDLLDALLQAKKSLLGTEQALLAAKLEIVRPFLRKGTLVYTHYVEGIVEPAMRALEAMGLTVGLFTGEEKSGLEPFRRGEIDVLLASSAIGIGLDGLQQVCNCVILLSPPWTSAAYEQIIGRVRRQGSQFDHVEVIIPQITLETNGEAWSWDERRMACIAYKRTLSDCVLDGTIPETIQINQQEFLRQSSEALERWMTRVQGKGVEAELLMKSVER